MKYIKYIWVTGLLLIATIGYAQTNKLKKADKKFENLAYVDALKIYEDVANSGYEDVDLYKKLGDGNYFNAKYIEAVKWYAKLVRLDSNLTAEYQFRYGQSLKAIGNYQRADVFLDNFFKSQGLSYSKSENYLEDIEKNSNKYKVNTVSFNTKYSDYPGFLKEDSLYIISGSLLEKKTPWNNEPTSDIFLLKNNGELTTRIGGDFNTKFNEGSLVITKDGKTIFFTRNDYNDSRKRGRDSNKTTRLKIYGSQYVDGKWEDVKELPFNNSEYSFGHPALSFEEDKLYFVSDMKGNGSKGGTDIYEVALFKDGTFGVPFNMSSFNTPGNEMFPFVAKDGTFYFSSNGQIANLGGLDVYRSRINTEGLYGKIENVGKPVNGPMDDFALVIDTDTNKGYFASNRKINQSDDVYEFSPNEDYIEPCLVVYTGVVKDQKTGDILENVMVSLVNSNNQIISQRQAVAGSYEFEEMDCKKVKFVRAEKNRYQTGEKIAATPIDGLANTDLFLVPRTVDLTEGTDLGILLNPIYFDLDKSNIRPDAEIELQKIIAVMRTNPTLKIDVRSHTDSRAPDAYNMLLSSRRAQATIAYIVRGGIERSRLTGLGYGETQLKNSCSNGMECDEFEHQLNRRSEFIIVNK
jgi:outer membrane protein OmpA-like peptidoglycan-associated protein